MARRTMHPPGPHAVRPGVITTEQERTKKLHDRLLMIFGIDIRILNWSWAFSDSLGPKSTITIQAVRVGRREDGVGAALLRTATKALRLTGHKGLVQYAEDVVEGQHATFSSTDLPRYAREERRRRLKAGSNHDG
jgi:hypothetical protein